MQMCYYLNEINNNLLIDFCTGIQQGLATNPHWYFVNLGKY